MAATLFISFIPIHNLYILYSRWNCSENTERPLLVVRRPGSKEVHQQHSLKHNMLIFCVQRYIKFSNLPNRILKSYKQNSQNHSFLVSINKKDI